MNQSLTPTREAGTPGPNPSFFQRCIVTPLVELLRVGCSPKKLAWSLVAGVVVGINPLLGSTTLLCLAVAAALRLNLVASQITNHIVYPLQLALFFVFLRVGDAVFHTGKVPLTAHEIFADARHHPFATTRLLWTWEWHALIVWVLVSSVAAPVMVALLMPVLKRMHGHLRRNETSHA